MAKPCRRRAGSARQRLDRIGGSRRRKTASARFVVERRITSDASYWDNDEYTLESAMKKVLENSKFQPSFSRRNGEPVAIKVAMPVAVIRHSGDKRNLLAVSGNIKDLTLLAVLD